MTAKRHRDLEVDLTIEGSKAIIEGKTSVPFKTFVNLILKRKVINLIKDSGDEPVIVSSKMLTDLASAPDDSTENRTQLIMVTLAVGILGGVFIFALAMIGLLSLRITLERFDFIIVAVVLLGLAGLAAAMGKTKKKNRGQKIADTMEHIASIVSK